MKKIFKYLAIIVLVLALDKALWALINGSFYERLMGLWEDENFPRIIGSLAEILIFGSLYYKLLGKDLNISKIRTMSPLWIVVIGLGVSGMSIIWMSLYDALSPPVLTASGQDLGLTVGSSFIPSLIFAGILGPIAEELIFRGILFSSLKRTGLGAGLAIVLSGLIFGLWHGNFVQAVYASLGGMVFAYVFYKTDSLGLVILIHIINNSLSSIIGDLGPDFIQEAYSYIAMLMVPVLFYKLYKMKNLGENNENTTDDSGPGPSRGL